jgi:hypothetical protein
MRDDSHSGCLLWWHDIIWPLLSIFIALVLSLLFPEAVEGIFHHLIHMFTVESCNRIVACTCNGTWGLFAMMPALSGKMSDLMVQDQFLRSKLSPNRQCSLTDLLLGGQSICVIDSCKLPARDRCVSGRPGFRTSLM